MGLQTKTFKLEVKEVKEDGTFEGYASVFGNVDSDGEVIDKGAFKRTLDHNKGIVPILWQHIQQEPIGWNSSATEDDYGLKVSGHLDIEHNENARKAYGFLKMGLGLGGEPGLSVGFMVPKDGAYVDKDGHRHFKQIVWKEYSVVTFPANSEATVISAKAYKPVNGVEYPMKSFAYVGDANDPASWRLPLELDGDDTRTKANIRVALATLPFRTDGVPDDKRQEVLTRVKALAVQFGLDSENGGWPAIKGVGGVKTDESKKDGMVDPDGSAGEPPSFEESMASHQAQTNLEEDRYNIDSAKNNTVSAIRNSDKTKGEKKLLIHKALHAHADAMTNWHGKAMDLEDQYGKSAEELLQIKGMSTKDHADMQKKLGKAMGHMQEARAQASVAKAANEAVETCHTKALGHLQDVVDGYAHNDVQLPNSEGKKPAKESTDLTEQKSDNGTNSDSTEIHSLTGSLGSLLALFGK